MNQNKQPGIAIRQIYLEHAEFSHRPDALDLPAETRPSGGTVQMEVGLMHSTTNSDAGIRLSVWTAADATHLYRFRVQLIALATQIEGRENLTAREYVEQFGPSMLYPFARETVANLTMRGRFGPLWLDPFNFRAKEQTASEEQASPSSPDLTNP